MNTITYHTETPSINGFCLSREWILAFVWERECLSQRTPRVGGFQKNRLLRLTQLPVSTEWEEEGNQPEGASWRGVGLPLPPPCGVASAPPGVDEGPRAPPPPSHSCSLHVPWIGEQKRPRTWCNLGWIRSMCLMSQTDPPFWHLAGLVQFLNPLLEFILILWK